jgi:hypothetical protein
VLWRPQIQADNVGRLAFEVRIIAGQVTLQAVRFETGFLPHPMDGIGEIEKATEAYELWAKSYPLDTSMNLAGSYILRH